jgi:TatD DNase family protein
MNRNGSLQMMIDSHVHLDATKYTEGEGVTNILSAAEKVGVRRFIAPSIHFDSFQSLLKIREEYPQVYPAVGVHPHDATPRLGVGLLERLEGGLERLDTPIVGETGLEGHYDFVPMSVQLDSLRVHLDVAQTHGLPVILHCRDTEETLFEELRTRKLSGVVHCFTGSWEWAQRFLDLGLHIGITGIVTFKKSQQVQEVATRVPQDKLLVETDGPYLAPIPFRGKINKPEYIPLIVKKIAELREVSASAVADFTTSNTESLFRLPKQDLSASV